MIHIKNVNLLQSEISSLAKDKEFPDLHESDFEDLLKTCSNPLKCVWGGVMVMKCILLCFKWCSKCFTGIQFLFTATL